MMTFCGPKRLEVGFNSFSRIGELVKAIGGNKVLVVMDAFLNSPQIGLGKKVSDILSEAGIPMAIYSGIANEPNSDNITEGLDAAKESECDCIVAIGGGSSIDAAKAVAALAAKPDMIFSEIPKQARLGRLPLIAIPTTSGTGSEATRVSVINNSKTGIKENPGHPELVPDIVILDPQLVMTLPPSLTAFTGMDALTHAMEAFVSNKANSMTDLYAYKAMEMIGQALPKVFANGKNEEERQKMAIASYYAGLAFSNASTNLAHAGGRALGAYFHIPHGLSVALLLPFVMEFGLEVAEERYARVAVALGADPKLSQRELARQAIDIVNSYNDAFGIWDEAKNKFITDLEAYRKAIPEMVSNALAGNGILTNPRIPTEEDVTMVFEKLAAKIKS
ncbi:iron-containing alcohol dehydrogenase [Desulfosporosinus sp. PR]|uniref:iron-containing alcohol dehydrogenase n=1 Tax=Candidatus Desulfosporosinus nitrosoreducens TaxID=3401928 RepID=UPI0027F7CF11|nr:iron-containing alcohol dehydrogenase [Desulfosporosinus sp. PR]MDQ7095260.1 iron-containing alcohol dehydrogenase [Desulfosporosinus sp. PR]